jgi:threonine dehydratase
MIPYAWLYAAEERIRPHIRVTPLQYDQANDLYLKWENHQITGSFKLRGALNKVLTLADWELARGLIAASAGNHGQGVALAGKMVGAPVIIFASEAAVPAKLEAMRALGAKVKLVPGGYGQAEQAGLAYAAEHQATWISPYNDGQVIAGQGTLGLETLRQLPALEHATWVVPVSGGGLIDGVGAAIKWDPNLGSPPRQNRELVGVQSESSAFMHAIYHQGSQQGIEELPSIADGLAGPVEAGSITIPLVKRLLDDLILVSEEETIQAIRHAWRVYGERIEGSAAVTLAAVLSGKITSRPALLILSGGNIQPEVHAQIIDRA